ncbi:maleylpyruvate isomerase family mycothiol-dependent enzyme, partial [Actinomadura adrarensis]
MSSWNFMDPASKKTLLDLVRREAEGMFTLAGGDEAWARPTACDGWNAGDVIGHLVDTTETYFQSFAAVREAGEPPSAVPLADMAASCNEGATQFRGTPQRELIERCRADADKMMNIFEGLSDAEWTGLMVPHKYMGPLPACFYAIFQLVDYAVHSWDIREGIGAPHALASDAADMLVPLAFVLWQSTPAVPEGTEPFRIGV